jgi:hypothetical protein
MVTGARRARQAVGHFWLAEWEHLLSEKIRQHHHRVALGAIAAQSDNACEGVALAAVLLSQQACVWQDGHS